ncbi:8923_t:CDS:10 [Funneliformis geosporum]|nr:8923_t:CDS:10 [Funneliformis geosporum]
MSLESLPTRQFITTKVEKVGEIPDSDKNFKTDWEKLNPDPVVVEWVCQKLVIDPKKQQDLWGKLDLEEPIEQLLEKTENPALTPEQLYNIVNSLDKHMEKREIIPEEFLNKTKTELGIFGKSLDFRLIVGVFDERNLLDALKRNIALQTETVLNPFDKSAADLKILVARQEAIGKDKSGRKWNKTQFPHAKLEALFHVLKNIYGDTWETPRVEFLAKANQVAAWKKIEACKATETSEEQQTKIKTIGTEFFNLKFEKTAILEKLKKLEDNLKDIPTTEEERNNLIKQIDEFPPYEGTDRKKYKELQVKFNSIPEYGKKYEDIVELKKQITADKESIKEFLKPTDPVSEKFSLVNRYSLLRKASLKAAQSEEEAKKNITQAIKEANANTNGANLTNLLLNLNALKGKEYEKKVLEKPEEKELNDKLNSAVGKKHRNSWYTDFEIPLGGSGSANDLYFTSPLFKLGEDPEEKRLIFTDLTDSEQNTFKTAFTPSQVRETWTKIIEDHQETHRKIKRLVDKITAACTEFAVVSGEENLNPVDPNQVVETTNAERITVRKELVDIPEGYAYPSCDEGTKEINEDAEGVLSPEQIYEIAKRGGKHCDVLTEEKGVVEARQNAKNEVDDSKKAIFDHAVLDNVSAINAAQVLLTKIKETAAKITTATASQAQAAVDELSNNVHNFAINELERLNTLVELHEKREEVLDTFADLGEEEKKLFTEGTAAAARLDSVAKVEEAEKILELFLDIYSENHESYTKYLASPLGSDREDA